MTDCCHPPNCLMRLEGGVYLWCRSCGAIKRHTEKVWELPHGGKGE